MLPFFDGGLLVTGRGGRGTAVREAPEPWMAEAQRTGTYLQRFPDSGAPIPSGTKAEIYFFQRPESVSIKAASADHTGNDVS